MFNASSRWDRLPRTNKRWITAIGHFGAALDLQPNSKKIEYILRNNLGYCLNMVGRYDEGERHCRTALDLNWTRPSAYRNLGISFHGQGKIPSAAWALFEAIKMDSADDRARILLKKLASDHPSLMQQCPWIVVGLDPGGSSTETRDPIGITIHSFPTKSGPRGKISASFAGLSLGDRSPARIF